MDAEESSRAIVPVREETVNFYGDELVAMLLEDGTILVPLKPICDFLGLSWNGQRERTRRDPVLNDALQFTRIRLVNAEGQPTAGDPNVLALPLDMLPGWLFGISESRVKPELREKIQRYRRECFQVLWRHFQGQVMPPAPPVPATGAEQALALAEAVVEIARQQVDLERRYNVMADYMRGHVVKVTSELVDHGERLTVLELRVGGAGVISEAQALEIAGAVKAVAHTLEGQGTLNPYQRVYGELYRRFNVSGYKNLPLARFAEAMAWLKKWHEELTAKEE